jgi:hypothetical protein
MHDETSVSFLMKSILFAYCLSNKSKMLPYCSAALPTIVPVKLHVFGTFSAPNCTLCALFRYMRLIGAFPSVSNTLAALYLNEF